ncbi:MAG: DUF1801 domain-containing protein [Dehalococcoidia bacterium]
MDDLFRLPGATRRDASVDAWLRAQPPDLRDLASAWFERIRACGEDVRELLHDGHPTACVDDVAFAYVDAFTAHVNVGFFFGAELRDPAALLEGRGRRMRHAKLRPGATVDERALGALIAGAYGDIRRRSGAR